MVEPTGWPSRQKPVVSSTGSAGADLLVGWGFVENSAIVFVMDCAKVGCCCVEEGESGSVVA